MSNNAKVGGILSIISGAFGAFHLVWAFLGIYMFHFMISEPFMPYSVAPPDEFFQNFYTFMFIFYGAIGISFALVGALGVVGGIFAIRKKRWGLALAGAIAGTVTFFPCGIPVIIFVTLGKPEFAAQEPADPVSYQAAI